MGTEIWKEVVGYEKAYIVSNLGAVKSIDRDIVMHRIDKTKSKSHQTYTKKHKGRVLIPYIDKDGYLLVCLSFNDATRQHSIHRLVAKAFIDNPENKRDVNHKDGDKNNNRLENLEWATPQENISHAFKIGLRKVGDTNPNSKIKSNDVPKIRRLLDEGVLSQEKIAVMFGVEQTTISKIKLRKAKYSEAMP